MSDIKPRYLVMVTGNNNNKYYKQIPHGDTWTAEYGRVGSSPQRREYGMREWDKKYNEKFRKGYVDQTDLVEDLITVEKSSESPYKEIDNKVIAEIVDRLQKMARKAISDNYNISSNKVTQAMVDEAQDIINSLMDISDLKEFNDTLLKLFMTIPRKMSQVSEYLSQNMNEFPKIIAREQSLLDVMRGQVVSKVQEPEEETVEKHDYTILEELGLEFSECDEKDISMIKSLLGESKNKFYRAWRVNNVKTDKKFQDFCEKEKIEDRRMLWHGSRNENWWSIINTGLVLRPTNAVITGKMFGYGIYYAPKAQKSIGYTSLHGSYWAKGGDSSAFMAVMEVAYGKPFDVYSFDSQYSSLTYEKLQNYCNGANCTHAHAGSMLRNDEIIVYKEEQCTIRYLVEIK